jgi:integrase
LSELAKSYGKSKADKTRSLQQLREIGALKSAKDRGQEIGTVNRHMTAQNALVDFMRDEGMPIRGDIDPRKLRIKRKTRGRDLTQSAKPQRVETMFHLPCMTGCAGAEAQFEPGPQIFHCANYFVPLLLYYAGGRREEFCALLLDEVVFNVPIPYIIVRPNKYRGLKTLASPRVLPIPSETLRLGFYEYYLEIEKLQYELLFPELRWEGSDMPLGDRFYKNFAPGLKLIRAVPSGADSGHGADKQQFTFKQLRKAFGAELKRKGVHTEERSDLLGHAGKTVDEEVYVDATELARMLELMEKIPNVTSHLQPQSINLLPWVHDRLPPPDARARERKIRRKLVKK